MEGASKSLNELNSFKVMVVDDNPTCLLVISKMLAQFNFRVLPFHSAAEALYTLKEKEGEFDLILIEVHVGFTGFVTLTGFKLLEHIENEFNIPVITMCAYNDQEILRQSLSHGTSFHLTKPLSVECVEVLRQKALQKQTKRAIVEGLEHHHFSKNTTEKDIESLFIDKSKDILGIYDVVGPRRMVNHVSFVPSPEIVSEDDQSKEDDSSKDEGSETKKPRRERLLWDFELHERFLAAVDLLGKHAAPRKILHLMNVEGVTLKQIASHLQKHRMREEKAKKSKKCSNQKPVAKPILLPNPNPTTVSPQQTVLLPRIPSTVKEQYPTRLWTQVDQRLAFSPSNHLMQTWLKQKQMSQGTSLNTLHNRLSAQQQLNQFDDLFGRKNKKEKSIRDINRQTCSWYNNSQFVNCAKSSSLIPEQNSTSTVESTRRNLKSSKRKIQKLPSSEPYVGKNIQEEREKDKNSSSNDRSEQESPNLQKQKENATDESSMVENVMNEGFNSLITKDGLIEQLSENLLVSVEELLGDEASDKTLATNELNISCGLSFNASDDGWTSLEAFWTQDLQSTEEGKSDLENILADDDFDIDFDTNDVFGTIGEFLGYEIECAQQEKNANESSVRVQEMASDDKTNKCAKTDEGLGDHAPPSNRNELEGTNEQSPPPPLPLPQPSAISESSQGEKYVADADADVLATEE